MPKAKMHIHERGDEKEINIIPSGKDGAELRREKHGSKNFILADGKTDHAMLQDAVKEASNGKTSFAGLGDNYDRIFGGN